MMNIYLYVLDAMADYEVSFLTVEIYSGRYLKNNIEKPNLIKVGKDLSEIKTMGGMCIIPDLDIKSLKMKNKDLLVLPGADTWQDNPETCGFLYRNRKNVIYSRNVIRNCRRMYLQVFSITDDRTRSALG